MKIRTYSKHKKRTNRSRVAPGTDFRRKTASRNPLVLSPDRLYLTQQRTPQTRRCNARVSERLGASSRARTHTGRDMHMLFGATVYNAPHRFPSFSSPLKARRRKLSSPLASFAHGRKPRLKPRVRSCVPSAETTMHRGPPGANSPPSSQADPLGASPSRAACERKRS